MTFHFNRQTGGCQAWTFHEFTVMEAVEKTAAAGGKVIEFYPGQKFSTDKPDLKFDHNATGEMITAVKAQLKKINIRAVIYGVVGILDESKRQHFNGNVSIEYEYNWSNDVIDAAQCIGFVRGYGQK